MAQYIERAEALQFVFDACTECLDTCEEFADCDQCMLEGVKLKLRDLPAADVQPVRHGRWKEWWPGDCSLILTGEEMLWMCSDCSAKVSNKSNFCPNCGARLDLEADDGK